MPQHRPSSLRRVITASAIGNFVEWFDFAMYGFLATLIAKQFFPHEDQQASLLETFAVFAVAFALRPLGGVYFGRLGDKIGRKQTLSRTILLMAGATTLVGLLPTYAQVGIWAPIALTCARCLQGFSAGGQVERNAGCDIYQTCAARRRAVCDRGGRHGQYCARTARADP